jgi:hypothetical protein
MGGSLRRAGAATMTPPTHSSAQGFELLMKDFPNSKRNQAFFVAYACRAKDAATYTKWRQTMPPGLFQQVAPDGISLEVCDARFMKKV